MPVLVATKKTGVSQGLLSKYPVVFTVLNAHMQSCTAVASPADFSPVTSPPSPPSTDMKSGHKQRNVIEIRSVEMSVCLMYESGHER